MMFFLYGDTTRRVEAFNEMPVVRDINLNLEIITHVNMEIIAPTKIKALEIEGPSAYFET